MNFGVDNFQMLFLPVFNSQVLHNSRISLTMNNDLFFAMVNRYRNSQNILLDLFNKY